jgi:hypothetical protein
LPDFYQPCRWWRMWWQIRELKSRVWFDMLSHKHNKHMLHGTITTVITPRARSRKLTGVPQLHFSFRAGYQKFVIRGPL